MVMSLKARVKPLFFDMAFAAVAPRWKTHDQTRCFDRSVGGDCSNGIVAALENVQVTFCFAHPPIALNAKQCANTTMISTCSNGVAPSCGTMLRSRPYIEADDVIAQVRTRTLSIEKWRRSALLPNRYVFLFFDYASLIMPTRGA